VTAIDITGPLITQVINKVNAGKTSDLDITAVLRTINLETAQKIATQNAGVVIAIVYDGYESDEGFGYTERLIKLRVYILIKTIRNDAADKINEFPALTMVMDTVKSLVSGKAYNDYYNVIGDEGEPMDKYSYTDETDTIREGFYVSFLLSGKYQEICVN
jgi:hypothetical protein